MISLKHDIEQLHAEKSHAIVTWSEVLTKWKDGKAHEFEKEHIQPILIEIDKVLLGLDGLESFLISVQVKAENIDDA